MSYVLMIIRTVNNSVEECVERRREKGGEEKEKEREQNKIENYANDKNCNNAMKGCVIKICNSKLIVQN